MLKIRLASSIQKDSIVDGKGIRVVLWLQGCPHHCLGCHNQETHAYDKGTLYEVEDIINQIKTLEFFDGITFSGGEPLLQVKEVLAVSKAFPKINKWLYSGYQFEEILKMAEKNKDLKQLLVYLDVIVDGKYVQDLKSLNLKFRGSSNQRIINVKRSLKNNKIVECKIDVTKSKTNVKQSIYI